MVELHLTDDSEFWTGQSTLALLAARQAGPESIVLTAIDDDALLRRFADGGVKVLSCKASGMFGSLNLSRVLRRIKGDSFRLLVYSPRLLKNAESALRLVGRPEPFELVAEPPVPEFPKKEVFRPAEGDSPLLMWLGNITENCGLDNLIERLGRMTDRPWRLRVVGQGKARTVSPILKRCKKLGIFDRIEWSGYAADPYEKMNGVTLGVVTVPDGADSVVAREFAAASIPVITNLSQLDL